MIKGPERCEVALLSYCFMLQQLAYTLVDALVRWLFVNVERVALDVRQNKVSDG